MSFDIKHLINIGQLEPGQRERVNHTDCEAGADTRRRLYVERSYTDPSLVLYYCHNCGSGGSINTAGFQTYRNARYTASTPLVTEVEDEIHLNCLDCDIKAWPIVAQAWAIKNGLESNVLDTYTIGWSVNDDRLVLPHYRTIENMGNKLLFHELDGYQMRKLDGKGPKYTTVRKKESPGYTLMTNPNTEAWVIVEDLASGIRLFELMRTHQLHSWGVGVNYGTKINTEMLYQMKDAAYVHVWFDNDSQYVVNQAKQIAATALLFGTEGTNYEVERSDPKHYNDRDIMEAMGWTA